jgi:choice-of-anchor B domain-containing protein
MKKKFCAFVLLLLTSTLSAQLNMSFVGRVNYQQLHGTLLNGVWGYVDETGVEYAIVGTRKGVSIVSLQDPANPTEIYWIPGAQSVWREVRVVGDYAYVTTEASSGLLIIDLTPLPSLPPILNTATYTGPNLNPWQTAHALFNDEQGYLYITGANRGNGGVIILDVFTNPMSPIEVGRFDNWYVHDGFARGNFMYLAHIYDGFFSVVDITDRSNPVLISTQTTPSNFTHNTWQSDDNTVLYTTDEVSGAFIAAYDITDPLNIVELDRIQSNPGLGRIPHNVYVKDNWLVTSYYADGVVIHDASRPHNLIEVGNYDTSPFANTFFNGAWGAFPYFPSNLILVSDMEEGLFIVAPDYKLASYLEGFTFDASNGNPLQGVSVTITAGNQTDISNLSGEYATGIAGSGEYIVDFSRPLYFPQTQTVTLTEGEVTNLNVNMVPIPSYSLIVNVLEEGTNNPIFDAQVLFQVPLHETLVNSNGVGEAEATLYYQEEYMLTVGKWGYVNSCQSIYIDDETGSITVHLKKGYYDDFVFDFGWTTTSSAQDGHWVRALPIASESGSAPGVDAPHDCGGVAYVTGNGSINPNFDQVTNGVVTLISPVFDLTDFSDPHLNYWTWYYNFHGPNPPPNDTLFIILSNGQQTVNIEKKYFPVSPQGQWIFSSIRVLDHITPTANMQLRVQISDFPSTVNITEAGFDYFTVSNANTTSIESVKFDELLIYPNPSEGIFQISASTDIELWMVLDLNGRTIATGNSSSVDLSNFEAGVYLLRVQLNDGTQAVQRLVKG